jgi:hypothetical protein
LQRDRDKQAKAAAKRDRRRERATETGSVEDAPLSTTGGELSPAELLKLVESVHKQFEDGEIDFETFEQTKAELLSRLPVD